MHFYESSIITTKDCMHCQVYSNEHPTNAILVKPKYIPTEKIKCDALQFRFIAGKRMNRLNMWIEKDKLKEYLESFKTTYPEYSYNSEVHDKDRGFFAVPIDKIERVYSPKGGAAELMAIEPKHLDPHLKLVQDLVKFFLQSGIPQEEFGITYSSLIGHYFSNISDINIIVHGKQNFWKLMEFLETADHPLLKWKTKEDWLNFYKERNRFNIFSEEEFLKIMSRKKSEGFFGNSLFIIFGVEKKDETWFKWGEEKYTSKGLVEIEATVTNNFSSVVRPGMYEVTDSRTLDGQQGVPIQKVVFYSRDYCMLAQPGEKIHAKGILEQVSTKEGQTYHRVVVGYFDGYTKDRREKEFIKLKEEETCFFCEEAVLNVGDTTPYGARIIYRVGDYDTGWFATVSPKTGGNPKEDFCIQLIPYKHLKNFGDIYQNEELAKNYGIAFAKINKAMADIMKSQYPNSKKIPMGTYGKCRHEDEHIHIKVFPFRNKIGQPYTLDSSYARKEVHQGEEPFVKMTPIKKEVIEAHNFTILSNKLIELLK